MSAAPSRRAFVAAALGAALGPSLASGGARADVAGLLDAAFRPLLAAHDIPGLVAGVTQDGRQHFLEAGVASRASGARATRDTLFEIGSLSKVFTATLATHAQALDVLSLADKAASHWPALRGCPAGEASLLHLGTYTAGGLPLQFPDAVTTLEDALAFYRQWQPTAAPGQVRRYSNPSIGLLGHLTALAHQRPFRDLAQRELFPGLGLQQTFLDVPADREAQYAWGYNRANQPVRVNPGMFDAEAYGVKSTAADLLRFLEASMRPASLKPSLRAAVEATHVLQFEAGTMGQALGWEHAAWPIGQERLLAAHTSEMALQHQPVRPAVAQIGGDTLLNKTGSTNGFGAYAAFLPSRQLGLVLLANRNIPNAARVRAAHAVLHALAA